MRSTNRPSAPRVRASLVSSAILIALGTTAASLAQAQTSADVAALQRQVQALQSQINAIQAQQSATTTTTPVTNNNAPTFNAGPVTLTLGGFVELQANERSRFEGADWASNWNTGIPLPNSSNYYLNEFHMTARQSRISVLAQGPKDGNSGAEAYVETDFGGAGGTANNNESSSYSPRMRHFYADYRSDGGWYFLFGDTWSLATQNSHAIDVRTERAPLTIDGQYLPGFSWTRVAQVRLVGSFANIVTVGVSAENPAALISSIGETAGYGTAPLVPPTTPLTSQTGQGSAYPNGTISLDPMPDIIAKVAIDPGFGHYEVLGMYREFRDRFNGANYTTNGYGYGANAILPLLGPALEFQASYLGGSGVGRYGSAQLPDVTLNPGGSLSTIKGYQAMAGVVVRPAPAWVLYGYYGREQDDNESFEQTVKGVTYGYGYGTPYVNIKGGNAGCLVEGGSCAAQTHLIEQYTAGAWWKWYQGGLGNAQVGLQASHTKRDTFADYNGVAPSSSLNVYLLSFRYYPFQK